MQKMKRYILIYGLPSEEYLLKTRKTENYLIPEMRPGLIGARVLLKRFKKAGLKTTLVSDNMLGLMFFQKIVKEARIFYFSKDSFGYLAPCGAQAVNILAMAHGVSVECVKGEVFSYSEAADGDASSFLGRKIVNYQCRTVYPQDELIVLPAAGEKRVKKCKIRRKKK